MTAVPRDPPLDYAGVGELFGLSGATVRRRMSAWEERGFPAPLPWSRREKLWRRDAVLAWQAREEARAGARPGLRAVS